MAQRIVVLWRKAVFDGYRTGREMAGASSKQADPRAFSSKDAAGKRIERGSVWTPERTLPAENQARVRVSTHTDPRFADRLGECQHSGYVLVFVFLGTSFASSARTQPRDSAL